MSATKSKHRIGPLKKQALEQLRKGNHAKALEALEQLEALEPDEGEWPRRTAECHRARGAAEAQVAALERAMERYAGRAEYTKALAMGKLILGIEPARRAMEKRLAELTEAFNHSARKDFVKLAPPSLRAATSERAPVIMVAPASVTSAPPIKVDARARLSLEEALRQRRAARAHEVRVRPEGSSEEPAPVITTSGNPIKVSHSPPSFALPNLAAPPAPTGFAESEEPPVLIPINESGAPNSVDEPAVPNLEDEPPVLVPMDEPAVLVLMDEPVAEHEGPLTLPAPAPEFVATEAIEAVDADLAAQSRAVALAALPSTPLFSELGPNTLSPLLERATLVSVRTGECVYRENDPADALYVVVSGSVAILAGVPPGNEIARLGEREFFGENSLIGNELRSTTVEALEPTELLRIDRHVLRELLEDQPRALKVFLRFLRERMVQHLLQTNPLLGLLSLRERRALASRFEFRKLESGELLIEQGARSPGLFILLSGTVDVEVHAGGETYPLALLHAGDVFGEMSLVSDARAMADVRSVSEGFVFLLPEHEFRHAVATHPVVREYANFLAESRRMQNAEQLALLRHSRTSAPPAPAAADRSA
jgi:CRP-like cAMP-binding protein